MFLSESMSHLSSKMKTGETKHQLKERRERDEKRVINYFLKNVRKANILTDFDLQQYVKKYKLNVTNKFINNLKRDVHSTALYSRFQPIKAYQTVNIPKLGYLSIDFAYYKKEWSHHNYGCVGFLMVNSVITDKRWGIPMKSRKTASFEKALEEICKGNIFPAVTNILSDRETTIFSPNFQHKMKELYNVKFGFIQRYNKAWSSENAIRHTKNDLSIALTSNGGKNWVNLLSEVIYNHNRQKVRGTSFSPLEIDDGNFFTFLNELHNVDDATMNFSSNSIDSRSIENKIWLSKIFKFRIGQKVLATRYALVGRKAFAKSSVEGTFDPTPFFIKRAKLRQTKDKNLLVQGKVNNY